MKQVGIDETGQALRPVGAPRVGTVRPGAPYADHLCLHELVERQASIAPQRTALVLGPERLSYAELNVRANQLAHHLRDAGVRPDDLVGLCIERSVEMVVGALGILKAGGAYVPLDPAYPADRLAYMLEDSGAAILVTSGAAWERPLVQGVRAVRLDTEAAAISGRPSSNPAPAAEPGHLAYAIYTSGSTGRPKGVEVLHRGIVNFIESMRKEPGIGPEDRLLAVTTLSFDIAGLELFLPLAYGAQVVLARSEEAVDAGRLIALLASSGATIMQATPATWRMLMAAGWKGDGGLKALCGGEAMTRNLADALLERCGQLWNMYGPTETTVWSTLDRVERDDETITIGRPIANTSVYILNDKLEPVPIGDPGELCIGGDGVARGYHNRPDLTAERFVPDPFDDRPGARMYRTGDLARRLPDGRIQCLGRIDHQVKIRGFRVELGEIESALGELAAVREAVVVARDDAPGIKRLVAYVVPWDGPRPSVGDIRRHLLDRLPDYMAPAAYVFLTEMPLTPNGKINRRALPDPGARRPELSVAYAPARDALEQFLQHAFAGAMGLDDVGINDDFFELGGNSIQAAMIANKIQEQLGEYVYVAALFDAPSVAQLAKYLAVNYRDPVARRWGGEVVGELEADAGAPDARMGPEEVTVLREAIAGDAAPQTAFAGPKNPPALFVLAPPRSGSTLLRVMLAGHPGLFAPPELELLSFGTLAERQAALVGPHAHWLEGTLRAVMELKACDAEEARSLVEDCRRRGMTTREFYGVMQGWIGDRLLVDKTSTYCLEEAALRRAEEDFRDARYIHLLRHPHAMIASFEEVRLDKIWFRHRHPFSTRQLAELVYIVCHQNIQRFLADIPAERRHRLVFEDLVSRPEPAMHALCDFLGLPFEPAMLKPYEDKQKKMTDGIHAVSRMQGDPKFHQHQGINANVADRWKESVKEDFLGGATWEIAADLGYERPGLPAPAPAAAPAAGAASRIPRRDAALTREAPLSFAQQRLWFLDRMSPGGSAYNIARAVRLTGPLDVEAMRRSVEAIIARHESLRTSFPMVGDEPVQRIAPAGRVELPLTDLSGVPGVGRDAAAMALAMDVFKRPFDLAARPPVRFELVRLGEREHLLLLSLHHIVSDWWSRGVFLRELWSIYGALRRGAAPSLPELPIQYADFAVWQRHLLESGQLDEQVAWWRAQFKAPPAPLDLRTDRPRPEVLKGDGATYAALLPRGLSDRAGELSRRSRVTLFMTLMAAFQALLHRMSRQDDIAVGTPIAGRTHADVEGLIGFFLNTLVIRTNTGGDPTFRELLERVRRGSTDAFARQAVPFERLIESLQLKRSINRNPLFDVMFILQNAPLGAGGADGLKAAAVDPDSWTSKFDLTLEMEETAGGLAARWEYSTELFDAATIESLHRALVSVLDAVTRDPDLHLSRLPLLNADDRRSILADSNDTYLPLGEHAGVHQMFEARAAADPKRTALVVAGRETTFGELNQKANRLAHHLRRLGVGRDELVGLCVERSEEMVVALLGILKAGGAYLPLDPAYPAQRLEYILQDSGARFIVTQGDLAEPFAPPAVRRIRLDSDAAAIGAEPSTDPAAATRPADLAYAIYTSGSTGRPKGVQIEHGSIYNFVRSMQREPGITERDRLLAVTTLSFDIAGLELLVPLSSGAAIVLATREEAADASRLSALLASSSVTILQATPATWRMLLASGWKGDGRLKALCGGEAMPRELAAELLSRCGQLWNMYGPTETTVWSTCERIESLDRTISIGRPIANTTVYILTDAGEPAGIGEVGELFIGGAGVARGYRNRPDLTAERFVADPFASAPSARMYRTGDLARWLPDGRIECLGRVDHQVKVRGFRIELGEIEAELGTHPAVAQGAAVVRPDASGQSSLVAYIVARGPERPAVPDLRKHLAKRLPDYMVPSMFVFLDALPLTPNGKVDRKALPDPGQDRPDVGSTFIAPRTEPEQRLAAIWEALLGLGAGRVGVTDDFFELGGHSLLGVALLTRIESAFGVRLPVASLFQHPTVEGLASLLEPNRAPVEASGLTVIQDKGAKTPFFLVSRTATGVLSFGPLAKRLGDDQPFYGLGPPPQFPEERPPFIPAKEVAALHVEQVRRVQPHGPYFLGGRCYGGAIAIEMAQQLRAMGEEVALVALISVGFPPGAKVAKDHGTRRLAYHLSRGHLGIVLQAAIKIIRRKLGRTGAGRSADAPGPLGEAQFANADGVMPGYRPQPFDGRVVLLNNSESVVPAWEALAPSGLKFYPLDGGHETMFHEPHAAGMASALAEEFRRAGSAALAAPAV